MLCSVPVMDVKAEGGSPSNLEVWDPRLYPCTPQPPWAWPQPPLQMPACLAALQRRDMTSDGCGCALIPQLWFWSSVMQKTGFPSCFWGAAAEQCLALGCHGSWLILCLALVWGGGCELLDVGTALVRGSAVTAPSSRVCACINDQDHIDPGGL